MTVDTKEIVTIVGYLIGVRKPMIEQCFREDCGNTLDVLYDSRDATIIRDLCTLRTALFQHYESTDDQMHYYLKNLTSLEWFDNEIIHRLEKCGLEIVHANYRAEQYARYFTQLITEHINNCAELFYDWINWEYIRDLFCIPQYNNSKFLTSEIRRYIRNISLYPFQAYIHWKPAEVGSLLYSDRKFLKLLYAMHKDVFKDHTKYRDADKSTKDSIYDFIDRSEKTAIAVDCENSDVFKLYSVLTGLNKDRLAKIEKITLYDDSNTTSAWDWLVNYTNIPVEHIEVQRVTDRKSLVDIKMTASVCRDFYENGITSFIIVSSDSDFWGLISTLPKADFLIMYEYEKCGQAIKNTLTEHNIFHCSIDDFCSANNVELKRVVLFAELEKHFPTLYGEDPLELTYTLYADTHINATKKEIELFCNKYVRTLKLLIGSDGKFTYSIQR